MPTADPRNSFAGKPAVVAGVLILLALIALIVLPLDEKYPELGGKPERVDTPQIVSDSGGTIERAAPAPSPNLSPVPEIEPRTSKAISGTGRRGAREPRATQVIEVSGRVDSWQDWNASFSDTVTRTYSAIFDSARLDTLPGGQLAFSSSGRTQDFAPVKRIFCRIDSVRELVKYTFPGQSVGFNIGIAFAASVSFRGDLHPGERSVGLALFDPGGGDPKSGTDVVRNQFIVVLNSPTGHAYTLRTGIECVSSDGSGETTIYYTRPVIVEFRRMVRYESLLSAAADTVFLVTGNPRAVTDLSKALPGSLINVVFVPREDPREIDDMMKQERANVRLRVSTPRLLDQSFLILNDSEALVEERSLDPDFKHIAQLRTDTIQIDQVGHPRVTHRTLNTSAIARLKLTYQKLRQINP